MKLNEVRCYPGQDYRLVNMDLGGKTFAYSNVNGKEVFEIYWNRDGRPERGHYQSRSFMLSSGQQPTRKYLEVLEFMKEEFNKIDWEALEVRNALTGEMSYDVQ